MQACAWRMEKASFPRGLSGQRGQGGVTGVPSARLGATPTQMPGEHVGPRRALPLSQDPWKVVRLILGFGSEWIPVVGVSPPHDGGVAPYEASEIGACVLTFLSSSNGRTWLLPP